MNHLLDNVSQPHELIEGSRLFEKVKRRVPLGVLQIPTLVRGREDYDRCPAASLT